MYDTKVVIEAPWTSNSVYAAEDLGYEGLRNYNGNGGYLVETNGKLPSLILA